MTVLAFPQPESDRFDEFWSVFPKRVGKPLAKAKWDAVTSVEGLTTKTLDRDSGQLVTIHVQASAEELIEAAKRYAKSQIGPDYKLKDGGRFTLHPATWINAGRFMDDL